MKPGWSAIIPKSFTFGIFAGGVTLAGCCLLNLFAPNSPTRNPAVTIALASVAFASGAWGVTSKDDDEIDLGDGVYAPRSIVAQPTLTERAGVVAGSGVRAIDLYIEQAGQLPPAEAAERIDRLGAIAQLREHYAQHHVSLHGQPAYETIALSFAAEDRNTLPPAPEQEQNDQTRFSGSPNPDAPDPANQFRFPPVSDNSAAAASPPAPAPEEVWKPEDFRDFQVAATNGRSSPSHHVDRIL